MQDSHAPQDQPPPYLQPAEAVLAALATDARQGLSQAEAQRRLARFGRNELAAAPERSAWLRFLDQFRDVLVLLLLAAALVSAGLWLAERDSALPYEALAILAIVLLNALLGYVQQARAARAVAALRQMSAARARVVRQGEPQDLPAAELVPGDLILVEEGDTIPADARLLHAAALQVAEAALTGESLPVTKDPAALEAEAAPGDRTNMLFSGTAATYGHGQAVVTATGMQTELGRIAGLLKAAPQEATPLQKALDRTGRMLGRLVILIALVMVGTILAVEEVHGARAVFDVLILGVALAVAAVPEGLPAVVTAVLSIGVQRMARRRAIIRRLAAVETLGSADVIASDKTGTLTRNEMTVRRIVTASGTVHLEGTGYAPEGEVRRAAGGPAEGALLAELRRCLTAAECASNARLRPREGGWAVQGDPTEGALLVAARKLGLEEAALATCFPRLAELPFSSERKLMSTLHGEAGQRVIFAKGAPDVLLGRCVAELAGEAERPLTPERRAAILAANEALAGEALRTLGIACRPMPAAGAAALDADSERDLVFLGLVGMIDPPRPEAKAAVARAKGAGIRPVMITGDHPATAAAIAAELGIAEGGRALTGAELARLPDAALDAAVQEVSIFARVDPEHKLRIVQALQRDGATVAMTGDGVNDAPALKTADIGIAMGITGTDVSREAADMVLADDNFATIVAAVEEGRAIFANIRKFLRYLLSSNIGEVLTMFLGVLLAGVIGLTAEAEGGLVLPLLATQILWINLVTDGAPALALGLDPADRGLMARPPRPRGEGVITGWMWWGIALVGLVMAAGTLLVLDAGLPGGLIPGDGGLDQARTMGFTTLTLFQLFNVFNARSDERSAFSGLFVNPWLWGAVGLSLGLHAAVLYLPVLQQAFSTVPLDAGDWLLCLAVASTVLWVREGEKLVRRKVRA
ncbi:cation-translocating P-type ATPase [Siccirubricoccus phaeus]|uniref:cation-translocating P-type ATPase n=1 Tax=Siccirubricoccus phaeus TaxID=2595053 RepID=UPI0011F2946F|nr:cation-translocating P-type ATPase [Siccirubricoccus phaeus]